MTATEKRREQFLELEKRVDELDSRIQSLMPSKFSKSYAVQMAKQMRYGWLPRGFLDKHEYRIKLDNLKSDLQWAKRVAPERVPDVKNKILEFVGTQSWMDGKQFHAKVDPLLDEKFEILMEMHALEMWPLPGPVYNSRDGEERVQDFKNMVMDFFEHPSLDRLQAVPCEDQSSSGREIQNALEDA